MKVIPATSIAVAGVKPKPVKPSVRPITAVDRVRRQQQKQDHAYVVDLVERARQKQRQLTE